MTVDCMKMVTVSSEMKILIWNILGFELSPVISQKGYSSLYTHAYKYICNILFTFNSAFISRISPFRIRKLNKECNIYQMPFLSIPLPPLWKNTCAAMWGVLRKGQGQRRQSSTKNAVRFVVVPSPTGLPQ